MNKIISVLIILLTVVSCNTAKEKEIDVSNVNVTVSVDRFEEQFYSATAESLPKLKVKYPFLFPAQNPDSVWLNRIENKNELELYNKSQLVFGDFVTEKEELVNLFKHIKYYHPTFKTPEIITLITNLDYQNSVMFTKDYLFIALDLFLGKDDEVYKGFPLYLAQNFDKSQLSVAVAKEVGLQFMKPETGRQFIDVIVNEGKKMYLLDCYLPFKTDAEKMGYRINELDWAVANETQIWKYFIENKFLYSTDADLYTRFVANAPFSKFYIDIDKDSPGKIGVWLGWQIVRSYMNNNNVTLQNLLQTNAEEIFKQSKYKPKK